MDIFSLKNVLSHECELSKTTPIVVGVSGGPDSLCLLHLLHSLEYAVIAAHVNHQLRPEADQEAFYVKEFADSLGIPFYQTCVDVHQFSENEKLSIEESARILRYRFLMEVADQQSAQALAVAHQADDQIETVLMHVLRGSGMSGLKGMPYRGFNPAFSLEIPIIRPLLGVWRDEILEYCQVNQIKPCYDLTNEDARFFRNRIRQELVPILTTYNTQAKQHLWQLAQLAGADDQYLENLVANTLNNLITEQGAGFFAINLLEFRKLDLALQRRMIRMVLAHLRSNLRDIGLEAVEKALQFLEQNPPTGECQLLDGVWMTAFRESKMMIFTENAKFDLLWPLLSTKQRIQLNLPGETRINPYWSLIVGIQEGDQAEMTDDPFDAYFDYDEILQPLGLTTGRSNERFTSFGMKAHSVKLGDLFTNLKVYPRARRGWPILRMGEQNLWVVGLRRSDVALVTPSTQRILQLRLIHR